MQQLVRLCNLYDATLQLQVNERCLPAPGLWFEGEELNESVMGPSRQYQVAQRIAIHLRKEGIYYCDGHLVDKLPGTRGVWRYRFKDPAALLQHLIQLPAFQADLFRYHKQLLQMEPWAFAAGLPQVTVAYDTYELEDCYMRHGRHDARPGGDDTWLAFFQELPHGTMAALRIPLRRDQCHIGDLYVKHPQAPDIRAHCPKWWAVITNAFRYMTNPSDMALYARDRRDVETLIKRLAHSLCRQNTKERVPFLVGLSNTGKSSLVEPMYRLYGDSLKPVVPVSDFPLEKVPYARYMVFEEFRLDTLPSGILFQLLEHAHVPCNIKSKAAVEVHCTFGKVACSNRYPQFPERAKDLQPALDNRLEFYYFNHPIPDPDMGARKHIHDVETPYVIMFMIMVYHGMQRWV